MSDQSQGAGWWQASDGKWYPPSQAPQPPPTSQPPPPAPGSAYAPPAPPTGPTPPGMIPPPPGMAYPAGKAPPGVPQKQGRSGCATAAIVVLVLAFLLGGGCVVALVVFGDEAVDRIEDARGAGRDDVEITSCELDDTDFMVAELEITNNSSDRSNYVIEVGFRAGDGTQSLEVVSVIANAVESGETRVERARSLSSASEELDCRVVEALRFSDEPGG